MNGLVDLDWDQNVSFWRRLSHEDDIICEDANRPADLVLCLPFFQFACTGFFGGEDIVHTHVYAAHVLQDAPLLERIKLFLMLGCACRNTTFKEGTDRGQTETKKRGMRERDNARGSE